MELGVERPRGIDLGKAKANEPPPRAARETPRGIDPHIPAQDGVTTGREAMPDECCLEEWRFKRESRVRGEQPAPKPRVAGGARSGARGPLTKDLLPKEARGIARIVPVHKGAREATAQGAQWRGNVPCLSNAGLGPLSANDSRAQRARGQGSTQAEGPAARGPATAR